jgi:hypothetical protein
MKCGVTSVEGLREVVRKFFPDEEISFRVERRLGELSDAIQQRASRGE